MITLRFRKRGDKDLKNTQKAFFCAAPADGIAHFETICKDLLEAQDNISIWYPEPLDGMLDEESQASYFADLAEMNLFVIPVTREFLTMDNRARTLELPFAIERRIPVLPIFMERELESLFNESCGALQCLSRVENDPTALPYEVKLGQFLDAVLVRDETIAKVRDSFAAYIFLSYRKKDRAYAQEIMRLIHERPFCRDIAIWYDEFLTPGEDFNESIREAFEKSGLFSLVVTPSILESPNYIMTTEYPMAAASGTPIMPLMAVPTDADALAKSYPGLPACIPADKAAPDAIAEIVAKALAIQPDDEPEHLFFMGLAYLNGIDVERNGDRALELLTAAADAGIGPAYTRISSMYENGNGVARDYVKAAQWQERYVDLLEDRFVEQGTQETLHDYIRACIDAQAIWGEIHNTEKPIELLNRALKYERLAQSYENLLSLAGACSLISNAYGYLALEGTQAYSAERKFYIQKMLSYTEQLCTKLDDYPDVAQYASDLYSRIAYQNLAMIACGENDYDAAAQNYQNAVDICRRQLAAKDGGGFESAAIRQSLLHNLGRLGSVLEEKAESDSTYYPQAEEACLACLDLVEELKQEGIDCEATNAESKTIGIALVSLALAYEHEERWDEARALLERRLALAKREYDETENAEALFNLATAYSNLSGLSKNQGDYATAEAMLIEAARALEKMAEFTGLKHIQRFLAKDYRLLSVYAEKQGHSDDSRAYVESYESLVTKFSSDSVEDLEKLMLFFVRRHNAVDVDKALGYCIKLFELEPDNPLRTQDIQECAARMEQTLKELGERNDWQAIEPFWQKYRELEVGQSAESKHYHLLFLVAEEQLAVACGRQDDLPLKIRSLDLHLDLAQRGESSEVYLDNIPIIVKHIKAKLHELGRAQDATTLETSTAELRALAERYPENADCTALFAEARNKLGWAYVEQKEDAASLEKAVEIYTELHEEQPANDLYSYMLCGSLYVVADLLARNGDPIRSRDLFERMLRISDGYPDDERFAAPARTVRQRLADIDSGA